MDIIVKNEKQPPHLVRLRQLEASFARERGAETQAVKTAVMYEKPRRAFKKAEPAVLAAAYDNNA